MPTDESVQALVDLLNSWRIPNDTRAEVDLLPQWAATDEWDQHLPDWPAQWAESLRDARDALRDLLTEHPESFNRLVRQTRPTVTLTHDEMTVRASSTQDPAHALVVNRVISISHSGQLARLKVCPDCGWAFHDTSRNKSRVWCAMAAGPSQRGCGAIAKTRRHRARSSTHG